MQKNKIIDQIFSICVKKLNNKGLRKEAIKKNLSLKGKSSKFDSLALTTLIINIEEKFNEKYKKNLNLLDEYISNDKIKKLDDLKFFLNEKINEKKK
mgnify:CR=1 FL=1|tara:strand:+ start:185 stop:475 length:291 start_codon:yes stop_codon:yes gene_type:complete